MNAWFIQGLTFHITEDAVNQALVASRVLFEKDIQDLRAKDIVIALSGDPRLTFCSREQAMDQPIWRLAADHGLVNSASMYQKHERKFLC